MDEDRAKFEREFRERELEERDKDRDLGARKVHLDQLRVVLEQR